MTRVDRERCYVLHRRAYRETSLILELFCTEHGRVAAVARGARAARSPMRGLSEPFVELHVSWSRRGDLATVTALESASPVPARRYSRQALWCGLCVNELLLRLLARDDPEPELFEAYADLLDRLHDTDRQAGLLRNFELLLLTSIGVAPDLSTCSVTGDPIDPQCLYRVDPQTGPVPQPRSSASTVTGETLLALAEGAELSVEQARSARHLMRKLIEHQLDGRPLQTPRMFRSQR